MPLNGKFLDKSGLTYLWSKLKDLFSGKVDKETGKGLSTNDYTTSEKTKLSGIETGANKTIVDSAMSSSSTNPVQNRVINTALSGKQNTLTFDSTPTQSSTNPVTSGGVWTDQQRQETEIGVVANAGAKNLLPIRNNSGTSNGVTFTVMDDGQIVANGTATGGDANYYGVDVTVDGSYRVSGCPAGGNFSAGYSCYWSGANIPETGNGATFTRSGTVTYRIIIRNGTTVNNLVFKPMLRHAEITDSTFIPYAKTNRELTVAEDEDRAALIDQVDGGAKNKLKNSATNATVGEAVFTVNNDGTVSVYTTSTTTTSRTLTITSTSDNCYVNAGDRISGNPNTTLNVAMQYGIGASGNIANYTIDEPYHTITVSGIVRYCLITVRAGVNIPQSSPLIFRPMICTVEDYAISPAFVPYRPSWQEMWEMIQALQNNS